MARQRLATMRALQAQQKLEATRERRFTEAKDGILDFMGRVSPTLARPHHFAVYVSRIEQAVGGGLRIVFSAPPQHGKTETTLHGLAWAAQRYPTRRHAYVTYNAERAKGVHIARHFRTICASAGLVLGGTLADQTLEQGGSVAFRGIEGGLSGLPVDGICILDDLFKDRSEATSPTRRAFIVEQYRSVVEPRVHPGGSIVVMATRWDPEDLSGVLEREGWELINLPALAEADDPNGREVGEALFPEMWPVAELEKKHAKTLEFTWQSLYQGHPTPPGGKIFRDAAWYRKLPEQYSAVYGLDLAYTERTSADWSVCCLMLRQDRGQDEPLYYVVHVDRAQVEAPEFALTLKARHVQRPGIKMYWRAGGTEKGAAQFLRRMGLPVVVANPPGDKIVSNTPLAAAWNDGRVLLPDMDAFPAEAEWVATVLDRTREFTGSKTGRDDEIDALGNAFAFLDHKPSSNKPIFSTVSSDGRFGPRPGF